MWLKKIDKNLPPSKAILWLLIALFVFGLALAGWRWWWSSSDQPHNFVVSKGETVAAIAVNLRRSHIVPAALPFKLYVATRGLSGQLKAGEYNLPARAGVARVVEMMVNGEVVKKEKEVLIREGMTAKEMNEQLRQDNFFNDDQFLTLAQTAIKDLPAEFKQYDFLNEIPSDKTLAGFLFPDTYRLSIDDGGNALIRKMLDNFQAKVTPELRAEVKAQGKTLYQIMTMAAIVEKEVRTSDDMKIAAGIFWRRLATGQKLQSCATLAYALGVNKPRYSNDDTQVDSPYNTYRWAGLPPSPIANPGLAAITAAIYPTKTDYNFFLSRPDTGQTVWAKTYDEQLANEAKYLP